MLLDRLVNPSGAERFAIGLALELSRTGFDVQMCATRRASGAVVEELRSGGVPTIALGRRSTFDVLKFAPLIELLRNEQIDVMHAHMFGSSVWAAILGRISHVPVVIAHEHGTFTERRLGRFCYGCVVGRLATRCVAVTAVARDRMVAVYGVPSARTEVVPAAYIPRDRGATRGLRQELGLPLTATLIGTVATMRPIKAVDVLVDAHARVLQTHPEIHLVLVGDGPSRAGLERQVHRLGTGQCVHFLGFREDVGTLLPALDIGVLSSHSEGTPLFVLECFAHGVPVVSTDVGGLREVVEPNVSAALVPPGDPEALATTIVELLEDRERAQRFREAGAARLSSFSLAEIGSRFAQLYRSLLDEAAARRA